jgi:hypothetical protein
MRLTLLATAGFLVLSGCTTMSTGGGASSGDPRAGEAEFREL